VNADATSVAGTTTALPASVGGEKATFVDKDKYTAVEAELEEGQLPDK
jgi:hypothetical protein